MLVPRQREMSRRQCECKALFADFVCDMPESYALSSIACVALQQFARSAQQLEESNRFGNVVVGRNMKPIGHVFQETGLYSPDEVIVTLLEGTESPKRTDFIFIEIDKPSASSTEPKDATDSESVRHVTESKGLGHVVSLKTHEHVVAESHGQTVTKDKAKCHVLFQVLSPLYEYEGFGFEKEAISRGQWLQVFDKDKLRRAVVAKQLGYFDENKNLQPYLDAIPPMSPAFMPSSDEIKDMILPSAEHRLVVGTRYPKKDMEVYIDLERVLRQGMLITGGVGTGKTTTLGTMMHNLLGMKGIEPHVLLIDPDGELGSDELRRLADSRKGYIQLSCEKRSMFVREALQNPSAFREMMCEAFGITKLTNEGKALYNCAKLAQNSDVPLSPKNFEGIADFHKNEEMKEELLKLWEENKAAVLAQVSTKGAYNVPELVSRKTIVHLDGSTTKDFNNFLYAALVSLENCFNAAVRRDVGLIAVIDEAHLLAPQNREDAVGDRELHREMNALLKSRIATTGPRNGMGLWLTTQRLAKLDKTLSTQTGQNLIAHSCEDVDFNRLKEIVGDEYAESARMLPKGHALVKSSGLRIFNAPVLVSIEKKVGVRSAGTSLLNRWREDYANSKKNSEDAGAFM